MARYCLPDSYSAYTFPRAAPPVTNAALSTAFQADQHLSTDWSDMPTPTSRYSLPGWLSEGMYVGVWREGE